MRKFLIFFGFLALFSNVSLAITINLPYGNVYGRNESVFINGTTTPGTTVYLYYYNSSLSLADATLYDSIISDSNGNYNFTWKNLNAGNFTLYVNTSSESNSTNVSVINPIEIKNLSPFEWFWDRKQRERNFYAQLFNITAKRPITEINFSTNYANYLQPFYMENLNGAYHNCFNLSENEFCYMVYRYINIPYSSTITIYTYYTIHYQSGDVYNDYYGYTFRYKEMVKNTTYYLIYSANDVFVGNGTKSGDYCCVDQCPYGYDVWREYLSNHGYPYYLNLTLNTTIAFIKISNDFNAVDSHVEGEMKVKLYVDENPAITVSSDYESESASSCKHADGSTWYIIVGKGTHNLTFQLTQGFSKIVNGDDDYPAPHSNGDWMIDYYIDIEIYAFNDTNYDLIYFNGSFSSSGMQKLFQVEDMYDIAKNSYVFYTTSIDDYWVATTYYNYLNGNNIHTSWYDDQDISLQSKKAINFTIDQNRFISGTNNFTIKVWDSSSSTWLSFDVQFGAIYLPKNDFRILFENFSLNDYSNLKDKTIPILWIGKTQNITLKITNLAPYNLTPTIYLLGPSFIIAQPKTIAFQPHETKYVTFEVRTLNAEPIRGFGLDTIFAIANSTDGAFGFNYTKIRVLPYKSAEILIDAPQQVQAGGLFNIHTSFKPHNYSVLYPHVMLDLAGTFGFEVGVSSANIGGNYTTGRCFDVTIWYSKYEPGVTLAYTTTTSGTFFTMDSLRMVPQHRFYIYDKYGFLNQTKGNENYTIGKILVGYGVLEPGDWDMYGSYDFMINGFSAEAGVIFSDWSLGHQYLYKFLDITEVPQSFNIISGPDQPLPRQLFNWIAFYPKVFPVFVYQSGGGFYARTYPTDPSTYWIPCISAGYSPIIPPFNVYIEFIKRGPSAFTIPAGQRLAVIDNQRVEPGQWSEGVDFKALAPLEPGVYNITVIVWDDGETGLFWYNTTQVQVVSAIPSPGIVVREEDYAIEEVEAENVSEASWITMKREVWVRNENPYQVPIAVWYASPLPEDAIYISGNLSGIVTYLASGEEVNPSNITYKVPGISAWTGRIIYSIGEVQTDKKLIDVELKVFNNATKTPQYNIKVNRSKFVPTTFEPEKEEITIDSLAPKSLYTDSFYALGDEITYPINWTINESKITEGGRSTVIWRINFTNFENEIANYTYKVYLPLEASNITLDGSPTDVTLDNFGKYVKIELNLEGRESKVHEIRFNVLPISVNIYPPKYPEKFWVGEYATVIIKVLVKNLATVSVNETKANIDIGYGENVTVYLNGKKIDEESLITGYYILNITNLTAGESRTYQIVYKTPTAEATAGKYSGRRIINNSQYLMYPIYVKSVASFPLTNLSMRLKPEEPFKYYDLKFCWETDKDDYLNPATGKEIDVDYEDGSVIIDLGELEVGGEKYLTCFLLEKQKTVPITPTIYDFFDWLINLIKNLINWLIRLFK